MALIHESVGDFVLFSHPHLYSDCIAPPRPNHSEGRDPSMVEMDHRSEFVAPSSTAYDSYPVASMQSTGAAYYETTSTHRPGMKAGDEASIPRPTPSASPSSLSQTFDPSSSVLSSTSGASAQSAASSVGGSPYAPPVQQMPFQDKWSYPLEGLGIAAGVLNGSDFLGYDASRQDFVGEYRENIFSALPCTGASTTSSISLAPAWQKKPFPYVVTRFDLLPDSQKDEMTIDAILREVERTNTDRQAVMSPASSTSTTGPLSAGPGMTPQPFSLSPQRSSAPDVAMYNSHDSLTSPSTPLSSMRTRHDSFLSQSNSGRFVASLHSSCWFAFTSLSL